MSNFELQNYEMVFGKHFIADKNTHLAYDCEDDDDSEQFKEVFASAKSYLNQKNANLKENHAFPILNNLDSIIHANKQGDFPNTWCGLASAFLLLTWYSLQLLRTPWRKSLHKVKSYSGLFQHRIYANFPPAVTEHLMGRMGYIYDHSDQTFTFHKQTWPNGAWHDELSRAAMEFFLVFVYCAVVSTYDDAVTLPTKSISELVGSSMKQERKKSMVSVVNPERKKPLLLPHEDLKAHGSNRYVTINEMRRHNQVPHEKKVGVVSPLRHRVRDDVKPSRRADDLNIVNSESFDDRVRYPPHHYASGSDKKARQKKSTPSIHVDNYVEAQPMSHFSGARHGGFPSRDSRIESGYYSEWNINKLGSSDGDKTIRSGDYVHALPYNRPPGDGEPVSVPPKYHEISPPRDGGNRSLRH